VKPWHSSHSGLASRCRADAGFTLVELLVAITLVGLISVTLFGGFRFGTRAWEIGTQRSERLDELQVVQAFLRGRLSQTLVPRHESEDGEQKGLLVGSEAALSFTAPWLTSLNLGGLYTFKLSHHDGDEGGELLLQWEPLGGAWNTNAGDDPDPGERVLLEGVESVTLHYYGSLRRGEDPAWHEIWDESPLLPQLLSLELKFAEDSNRYWPKLVVALRAQR